MANTSLEATVDANLIAGFIAELGSDASATVPLLQAIQTEYGYLPRKAMDLVVDQTQISGSQLYGVATFYAQFRLKPVGRHLIKVCHGTACHVTGADRINTSLFYQLNIHGEGQDTASNGSYTVIDVACIGCCSQAPLIVVNEHVHGNLNGSKAQKAVRMHARKVSEELPQAVKQTLKS